MKKIITAINISIILMIVLSFQVYADVLCNTDDKSIELLQQGLIQRRLNSSGISTFSNKLMPNGTRTINITPAVGNIRVLVLPIEFANTSFSQESLDLMQENFFGDRDEEYFTHLPVKEAYNRASYGKLNISGDILPVYKAPEEQNYYANGEVFCNLIEDAIKSYTDVGFSQYDGDGDGYLDILMVEYCVGSNVVIDPDDNAWGGHAIHKYQGALELPDGTKIASYAYCGWHYDRYKDDPPNTHGDPKSTYSEIHEMGHLFGLPDNYNKDRSSIDSKLYEIMGGGYPTYFNVYYKYMLGWISENDGSALVLTYDDVLNGDGLKEIELCPAEKYGEEAEEKIKAVFIVPDKTLFPYTEFYVVEYRVGGICGGKNDYFAQTPGIVIWHCDTDYDGHGMYKTTTKLMKSVYKSNSEGPFNPSEDIYFAGDEFSAETSPSSNFNNDVYTGAYVKVNSIDSEKAVITAGFKKTQTTSPPTVKIEPDKTFIKAGGQVTYTITYDNYTDIPFMEKYMGYGFGGRRDYTINTFREVKVGNSPYFYPTYCSLIDENTGIVNIYTSSTSGEGEISITIGAGTAVNGPIPAPRVTSPIVYVDSTPPEIKINGDSKIRWEYGKEYVDPGAKITDNLDPDIESKLIIDSSEVNPNKIGTYSVYYNATDHAGNKAEQVVRTVMVFDPFIKDIQYSATEPTNQDVTVTLIPYEGVTSETGFSHTFTENDEYTFDLTDAEGNTAKRTVEVTWIDKIPPTAEVIYTPSTWTNRSVDVKLIPSEPIIEHPNKTWGSNTDSTFKITDLAGNVSMIPIKITWFDNIKPVIKLNGDSEITLKVGEQYIEQGAEVTDNLDNDIASKLVIDDSDVNTGIVGTYYVYYDATDHAENKAVQVVRTVNVREARTISFVNYDKSILQSEDVALGTIPEYKGETPAKPSDDGYSYRFTGWLPEIAEVTENATYTAQFEAIPREYTVTLNKNGGDCEELTSYTYGVGATLPEPKKTGYTFDGWYENENYDGEAVTEIKTTDTGEKTYYAKWTVNTYTVTLNANGGECEDLTGYTYGVGATLPEPKKTGYTFDGWYENENYDGEAVTEIKTTDMGEKTYYAKWIANTYTVTLNKNGGECEDLTSYTYGAGATLPEPKKTGYTFGGWYENENYDGEAVVDIKPTDTGDKTYYAKWTKDEPEPEPSDRVEFTRDGGEVTARLIFEKTLPPPENEIRVFAVFSEGGVFRYAELLTVSDMTAQFTIPEKYAACDISLYVWDKNLCPLMNVQRMEAETE